MSESLQFLFVHGTGGRSQSASVTLGIIRRKVRQHFGVGSGVEPVVWGDACGARIPPVYTSMPTDDAQAQIDLVEDEAAWAVLVADPLTELRLLAQKPGVGAFASPTALGKQCLARLGRLKESAGLESIFEDHGLGPAWRMSVEGACHPHAEVRAYILDSNRDAARMSVPIAHMLVAQTFSFAIEAGHPGVNRQTRQTLIDPLVEELGGPPLGVGEFLLAPFLRVTTALLKRNRLEVSSAVVPFVADIILYQARGGAIRDYIANAIPPAGDPIILLAHSLGGVACVDLLIERDLRDRVKALITAGSQAPLFYELNALQTLAFSRELPTHFPLGWLNFFDRNDFLAYIGSPVFGTKVRDFGIDSGTPFPNSHSAYWNCDSLWETVKSNLAPF